MKSNLTYRVLNNEECLNYDIFGYNGYSIINRNQYLSGSKNLNQLSSTVNSHIIHGNTIYTDWISTSKNLIATIENYGYSEYNMEERPYLAIIKGHAKTNIELDDKSNTVISGMINMLKQYKNILEQYSNNKNIIEILNYIETIKQIDLREFNKIILDCSTYEDYFALQELGLITNCNGEKLSINNTTAPNYAQSKEEVLVYKEIQNRNVLFAQPLIMDLLYVYLRDKTIYQVSESEYYLEIKLIFMKVEQMLKENLIMNILSKEERMLYNYHYRSQESLLLIKDNKCFGDKDMNYLIDLKESLLSKICFSLNIRKFDNELFHKNNNYSYEKEYKL